MRINKPTLRTAFGLFGVLVLLTIGLAACGGSGDDDADTSESRSGAAVEEQYSGGGFESDDDGASFEEEPAAAGGNAPAFDYVGNQVPFDRLIIRTVNITLTVESVSDGAAWIRDLAARKSGFVFSSNTYVRDESEFAQITIRVPANELDSTVRELREHQLVVQVDSEESTSQDVSQEYVDNESRLEALEETQRRFLALLSEAETVEEILRIENELTNIRSQIETIKGRQNYLDQMTSLSTVTVTLHVEDAEIIENDDDEGFFARVFGDAWDDASGVIEGLLAGTITAGIIGLALLPFLFVLYVVGRLIYRRAFGSELTGTAPKESVTETAEEQPAT